MAKDVPKGAFPWDEADRMFTLLVKRAGALADSKSGSPEEEEFDRLASAIEAYEAKRWPKRCPRAVARMVSWRQSSCAAVPAAEARQHLRV